MSLIFNARRCASAVLAVVRYLPGMLMRPAWQEAKAEAEADAE